METLTPLASALGLGMLAGARLYATVFAIGLLLRFEWISLPAAWQHASVLADTRVLIASGIACAIEFIADKIPWVDSAWDSVHTFIRPVGAALITSSLFSNLDPAYKVVLFLLAGGVAFSGHSAKAATRLAANHSPEPFSNIALSLGEDAFVAGGLYMAVKHPWAMAAVAIAFLALFAWLAPRVYRALRVECSALAALLRKWTGNVREPRLSAAEAQRLAEQFRGLAPERMFRAIGTRDVKGLRNRIGTLCLVGHEAVFFYRTWGKPADRRIGAWSTLEFRKGLIMDELSLVEAGGSRIRFDLPAGQIDRAPSDEIASRMMERRPVR